MTSKQGIQPEDLYHLKSVADPQLSPDGTEVVYVETRMDEKKNDYISNLFYINLKDKTPQQWTFGEDRTSSPVWSPDGSQIAFCQREQVSRKFMFFREQVERQNR